jgi:hypothetical protein
VNALPGPSEGEQRLHAAVAELSWMSRRGGVVRAVVDVDGSIRGIRLAESGSGANSNLIEVWIPRPRPRPPTTQ